MTTLVEAQMQLKNEMLSSADAFCPCCKRRAKIYREQIDARRAYVLIRLWQEHGDEYGHATNLGRWNGSEGFALVRHWGLIEEKYQKREDGGRAGWWKITPLGVDWINERISVPRYAHVFDSTLVKLTGEPWSVRQALKKRFNYEELMSQ